MNFMIHDLAVMILKLWKLCLPLVHVMLGIVQPHSDFDGIAFANPMEHILHFERI